MINSRLLSAAVVLASVGPLAMVHGQIDEDTYLHVGRTLGFRPAPFITVNSDYRFEVGKDRSWSYRAYDGQKREQYSREGRLSMPLELLEQRLGEFGLNDIPEPDPNAPQVADLPEMNIYRTVDGEPWHRDVRPGSKEALKLHYLIQFIVTGVRELSGTDYSLKDEDPRGVDEPRVIEDREGLLAAFQEGDSTDALAGMIDFEEEVLVVFRWAGSGQDDLFAYVKGEGEGELIFAYRPGMTRDLRQHQRLYVVAKQREWEQVELPPARFRAP